MKYGRRISKSVPAASRGILKVLLFVVLCLGLAACTALAPAGSSLFDTPPLPDTIAARAPDLDAQELERAIHRRVNAIRADHGVATLKWAEAVAPIARAHSHDMAVHRFFGHTNPRGEDASDRAARAGIRTVRSVGSYRVEGVGENLFATHRFVEYTVHHGRRGRVRYDVEWKTPSTIAAEAVAAWMQSPAHQANLLSSLYRAQAIGVVLGEGQTVFVTQNFLPGDRPVLADRSAAAE